MRPADRLFQILLHLGRGRVVTAKHLATSLEVSERTIYRDIANLMGSGIPIDGEAGVGYRLNKGYQVPPLMFGTDELQALVFGVEVVKSFGDTKLAEAAERVLAKVDAVLPDRLRPQLASRRLVVPGLLMSAQTAATLGDVREAINEHHRLFLNYGDAAGEATERIVWPLTLVYWGKTWTLGAWCELRQAFRSFRVDRISEARTLNTQFPDESGKRLHDYLSQAAAQ
jgi:predicted DNA-binding transcriptional regulator YafY